MVDSSSSYLNTLIFCIIAKAVTVGLLVVLLLPVKGIANWAYLILTIEIGLLFVIVFTLYKVSVYESSLNALKTSAGSQPAVLDVCPDYFIKNVTSEDTQCLSQYTTADQRYQYKFTESSSGGNIPPIDLTGILATPTASCGGFSPKTMNDVCTATAGAQYANVSWTDLKSKCGVLDLYTT